MNAEAEVYEAASTVRAMLALPDLSDKQVTEAARELGWPVRHLHPYLVAQRLDR